MDEQRWGAPAELAFYEHSQPVWGHQSFCIKNEEVPEAQFEVKWKSSN